MDIDEESRDLHWCSREWQNEGSRIAVTSTRSSMIMAKISRKVPLNRDYFFHVGGWNIKNVLKDEALSICDPQTCILLPFVAIPLESLSFAESHLNQRADLSCCVSEDVSGVWPSVTTHWLHWDLHIWCILTFDYYLQKKIFDTYHPLCL